jgi:AraC-like DNA-binding protein
MDKLMEVRKTLQAKYSGVQTAEIKAAVIENSFVKRFYEIVEEHIIDDDFSIEDLADSLNLSRSQVHRKIKGLTGMSTSLYIRHIRLQKAMVLLTSTDLNVSEIAYQTGFKTPVYFSQVFKESFGISPSEARENG